MHLFTVYYTHKPGGLCKRLYQLSEAIARDPNINFTLLTLDPEKLLTTESVTTHRIPFLLKQRCGLLFWCLFSLYVPIYCFFWTLRHKNAHAFVFHPYYAVLLLPCRWLGTLHSITTFFRSVGSQTYAARKMPALKIISQILEQLAWKGSDRVITQTLAMRDVLSGARSSPSLDWHLLPNDVPNCSVQRASRTSSLPIHCIAVGKFDAGKNIELLINVFSKLPTEDFKLSIIGEGPSLQSLKRKAEGIRSISFVDWTNDITAHYQNADLLLHPSYNEGMPNAVLEAFAHEVAVLAARTPELAELVGNDRLLFDPKNSEELERLLKEFRSSQEFRQLATETSKERKSQLSFDWAKKAKQLLFYS